VRAFYEKIQKNTNFSPFFCRIRAQNLPLCDKLKIELMHPSSERRLEAGGFEPPSRDVSRQASTCLVAYLNFALLAAKRQASGSAILESSRLSGPKNRFSQPVL